ncbi:MAG TPA: GxxExxY protein [Anaerolineae bacterium]|nr:GxxExxY protein [Anaerolineae bacterium]
MKKSSFVKTELDRITYQIIGIAMDVHNQLGSGHREEAYHNALVASASPNAPKVTTRK